MHWCILLEESPEYEVAIELEPILRPLYKAGTDSNNGGFCSLKGASLKWQEKCSSGLVPKHAQGLADGDAAVTKSHL